MPRGLFLSLDGVDGAGKSTQCRLLAEALQARGRSVVCCRDPGGTPVGDRIRAILLDAHSVMSVECETLLYMASRAQLVHEVIRPALQAGSSVIADRFLLANVAYQGHAGDVGADRVRHFGELATVGLVPDLSIVLDISPNAARLRKSGPKDRLESRGEDYFARVRAGFLAEAARDPNRIKVIDASGNAAAVQARIWQEVERVLGECPRS